MAYSASKNGTTSAAGSGFGRPFWIAAAVFVGIASSATFSGWLQWDRTLFILPYMAIAGTFLAIFFREHGVGIAELGRAWPYGLAGAAVFGFFVVQNVVSQPASPPPQGIDLAWSLLLFGVLYGLVDALLLNVVPVLAVQGPGFWDKHPEPRRLVFFGIAGLLASVLVAGAYHVGFTEFRGAALVAPVLGNSLLALSYVLTRSPLAPIGAHIAMHVAGVLHGMESVVQLPPHY